LQVNLGEAINPMTGLKERLLSVIANIEERTDSELISIIKDTLTAVGTGTKIEGVNEQYQFIYKVLDERLSKSGVGHDNQFDDLWGFYTYWKENGLDTYASRRAYVRNLYKVRNEQDDDEPFWAYVNATIKAIAKPRFDSGQYADAVEASYKELNSRVKEVYRQKTGEYEDGAKLMSKAFSVNNPVIVIDDLDTEDGRNIQNGYMQILAGSMTGIRNPKAHSNHDTSKDDAIPLILLASHLFCVLEDALKHISETVSEETVEAQEADPTLFLRLENTDDHEKLLGIKDLTSKYPGDVKVVLVLGRGHRSAIRLPMSVDANNKQFVEALTRLLGNGNVVIRSKK